MAKGILRGACAAVALGLLGAAAGSANAQSSINVAFNRPVVGGSGAWNQENYLNGTFSADNVTDNQNDVDGNPNGGPINEPAQDDSYWLGKDGDVLEDFVVDLGAPVAVDYFELVNSRNGGDRATGAFEIYGSNTVAARSTAETGAGGVDLVDPVLLASGTLSMPGSPPPQHNPETFDSNSATPYRYIRFNTLGATPGLGNVGLNEIRVFEVPEPAGLSLLAVAAGGLLTRRRAGR